MARKMHALLWLTLWMLAAATLQADPDVSNIRFQPRPDRSGMVDIYYDLSGGAMAMNVLLYVSQDGGENWLSPTHLSGDIGPEIPNGTDHHVVWNAREAVGQVLWSDVYVKITAREPEKPNAPVNQSPKDGADVTLPVTLSASAFSDPNPGDSHAASQWRIRPDGGNFGSPVWDSGTDSTNLTSRTVPDGILQTNRYYYWLVRYQDSKSYWSHWSIETGFQTYQEKPPNPPVNQTPSNGETGVSLMPTLTASAFSDPNSGDSHAASQWQITSTGGDYSSPVWDSGADSSNLTSIQVLESTLDTATSYSWRVRYQDSKSYWSDWSSETGFQTTNEITLTLPGDVPLVLVKIPAGSFEMGRYPGEQDSNSREDPQHTVNISYDFYMAKYELTKAQWMAVMGTTPWSGESFVLDDPDSSPATLVSWDDAQAFMEALNTHLTDTGQSPATMRLPSEAEWEYACRAGTTTRFYWGDDLDESQIGDYAWYRDNAWDAGEKYAHGVGQKLPNAWGLYDMSGNVWEWCQDDWHSDYTGAPTDGSAWGDGSGSDRVRRGCSWGNFAGDCRSGGSRHWNNPDYRDSFLGFRLALSTGP